MILKTLYIVRHGQTDLNKQGIVQGRGMNTDLNDEGRKQAVQGHHPHWRDQRSGLVADQEPRRRVQQLGLAAQHGRQLHVGGLNAKGHHLGGMLGCGDVMLVPPQAIEKGGERMTRW